MHRNLVTATEVWLLRKQQKEKTVWRCFISKPPAFFSTIKEHQVMVIEGPFRKLYGLNYSIKTSDNSLSDRTSKGNKM